MKDSRALNLLGFLIHRFAWSTLVKPCGFCGFQWPKDTQCFCITTEEQRIYLGLPLLLLKDASLS